MSISPTETRTTHMTPLQPLTSVDLLAIAGPHCSLCPECEQHQPGGDFDATVCECPHGACLLQDDVY